MRVKEIIQKINHLYILYRQKWLKFDTTGYSTISSIITDYHVRNHLQGHYTLGVFAGSIFTKFICFDVDVINPQMAKWTVYKLVDTLQEIGIPGEFIYISTSGNKGYHVEIFFNKPVFNTDIKQFYLMVLNYAELLNIDYGKVELRPTHTQGVKLPLGKHFTTNRICWYVDYEKGLKPIEDINYILTIQQMDSEYFYNILNKAKDFIKHLNNKVPNTKCSKRTFSTTTSKKLNIDVSNEHIDAIRRLDVAKMKELLVNIDISNVKHIRQKKGTDISIYNYIDILVPQKPPTTFKTDEEFYKFIDTIDLYNFLGVENKTFNCILPFHDDKRPSAGIIINEKGHFVYNCFGCGFKGGIIKLIEAISGCTRYHAINFIKQVYNIDLKTEWQKEQQAILEENIKYLTSGKMEEDYPTLWTYIKPRLDKLILLNVYAKNNIMSEDYSISDYPIFFGSLNYFMKLFATNSKKTTNNTIQLFALLDLIDKVPLEDIPDKILSKAKQQKKNGYITEQEVIEELKNEYGKVLTQIQLKRSLQEILSNYCLKRIRANKKLKEQYGVTTKGYPFLILKETEE